MAFQVSMNVGDSPGASAKITSLESSFEKDGCKHTLRVPATGRIVYTKQFRIGGLVRFMGLMHSLEASTTTACGQCIKYRSI